MLRESSPLPREILTPETGKPTLSPSLDGLIDRRIYAIAVNTDNPGDLKPTTIDQQPFAYTEFTKGISADQATGDSEPRPHLFLGRVGDETVYQVELGTDTSLQYLRTKVNEVRMKRAVLKGIKQQKKKRPSHV